MFGVLKTLGLVTEDTGTSESETKVSSQKKSVVGKVDAKTAKTDSDLDKIDKILMSEGILDPSGKVKGSVAPVAPQTPKQPSASDVSFRNFQKARYEEAIQSLDSMHDLLMKDLSSGKSEEEIGKTYLGVKGRLVKYLALVKELPPTESKILGDKLLSLSSLISGKDSSGGGSPLGTLDPPSSSVGVKMPSSEEVLGVSLNLGPKIPSMTVAGLYQKGLSGDPKVSEAFDKANSFLGSLSAAGVTGEPLKHALSAFLTSVGVSPSDLLREIEDRRTVLDAGFQYSQSTLEKVKNLHDERAEALNTALNSVSEKVNSALYTLSEDLGSRISDHNEWSKNIGSEIHNLTRMSQILSVLGV